ncbi:MAG: NPCBM/NEW2 domain-containing protein, partial [Clostridium sp.]
EEYNPLNYIKATNYKGEDISNKIESTNNIDVNKKGEYYIDYKVTDNDVTLEKKIPVIVVSEYDYASDVAWESATSGWRTVNKDSAVNSTNKIKLKVDGSIKEFDKGIGAATNAEIVYNLEGKDFEYFSSYVGTDKNYDDDRTTIQFKVIADGEEIYSSSVMKKDSEAEYIFIPIEGVKELKLIADNVDGNGIGDFASWGDTRFIDDNSKPTLEIPNSEVTKLGVEIENLIGDFKAIDVEDGDITNKVTVENNINFNKTGVYEVIYTVTDSDGNTVSKKREIKVVDMDDSQYLSDIDWKSAVNSYGKATKDIAASGKALRLTGENGQEVSYEKGIGTHSTSTIIYDLTNTSYGYFTSYVGVDRQVYGSVGSVAFKVYLDNKMVYDSGRMNSKDEQKFIEVNLEGAKELKLVVTDGGNGNGSDHATWGDTKLHYANNEGLEVNKAELNKLLEEVKNIDSENFTKESYD